MDRWCIGKWVRYVFLTGHGVTRLGVCDESLRRVAFPDRPWISSTPLSPHRPTYRVDSFTTHLTHLRGVDTGGGHRYRAKGVYGKAQDTGPGFTGRQRKGRPAHLGGTAPAQGLPAPGRT